MCMFFFFKQKTAYEMRISDWSSDVCSSDLRHPALNVDRARRLVEQGDIVGLPAHAWRQVAQGYWPRSGARAFQCHRPGRAGAEVLGDLVEDHADGKPAVAQHLDPPANQEDDAPVHGPHPRALPFPGAAGVRGADEGEKHPDPLSLQLVGRRKAEAESLLDDDVARRI